MLIYQLISLLKKKNVNYYFVNCFNRHPDKTDHPDAENKFVKITRAYEVC